MGIRRETEKRRKKEGRWRGWKSKVSVFLIMSLLLTGTKGVSVQGEGEERKNYAKIALEVEGNRVRLHFTEESLRELSEKAIQEGKPVSITEEELSYSNDPELLSRYRAIFAKDKEIYEIPLSDEVEGLDALPLENGGKIRAFVEAEPKAQTESTERSEEESVLLFSENSEFGKLMAEEKPDWYRENLKYIEENKKDVGGVEAKKTGEDREKQETKESKENSAESTGKEENGATCPPVLSPSEINTAEQLPASGSILPAKEEKVEGCTEKAKGSVENTENHTEKAEISVKNTESHVGSAESQSEELESSAEKQEKQSENSENQLENSRKDYHVSGIETIYFLYENMGEENLSFRLFVGENSYPTVRLQGRDKVAAKTLMDGKEYFSDIRLLKFQKYSLNELGRYSQNKEVEGFGTVEAFYDKEAFSEKVSLNVTLLKKPEDISEEEKGEESGGEKSKEKASSSDILKENEVEALKNRGLYEQSLSLDIRFLNKEGKEVEPSLPVSLRFYIEKKLLPEKVESENIAIHHLVEKEEDGEIAYVETLSEASSTASREGKATVSVSGSTDTLLAEEVLEEDKERNEEKDENKKEEKKEVKKEVHYNDLEDNHENGEKPLEVDKEGYIVRECNTNSFSTYTLTWPSWKKLHNKNYEFFFIDGDFRKMGPDIEVDMSEFKAERPLFQNKYYNPYHMANQFDILYLYHPFTGYTRHIKKKGNHPDNVEGVAIFPSSIALKNMNTETNRNKMSWTNPVVYLTNERVITQWHFDTGQYTDSDTTTFWNNTATACSEKYYLFYKLNEKPHAHSYTPLDMEMKQEKYITKKSDGSYDLTLTARPALPEGEKNKLDIIVVYDKSIYMGLDFSKTVGKNDEFPYNDAHNNNASKNKFANLYMYSLLDDIAKNPDYDTQFALVTMGGTRNLNVNNAGWFSVTDAAGNDAEKVIGFTKNFSVFKQKLDSISIEKEKKKTEYDASAYEHHGLNYAAGIKEAEAFQNGAVVGEGCNKIRQDAKRVVLFLTAYDPNFSYFPQYEGGGNTNYFLRKAEDVHGNIVGQFPGKVKDHLQLGPDRNKSLLKNYDYFWKPKAGENNYSSFSGYSYGSGRGFEDVALTQARGALTELNKIDAFYAIGLGPASNYSHLEDLIGAKRYWATAGHPWEQPLSKDIKQEVIKLTSNVRDDLVAKKEELRDKIAPPISPLRISKVNIWDQLSENVKVNFDNTNPTDKAAKLRTEVWKVDDNGKPLAKVNTPGAAEGFLGYNGVDARYDPYNEIIKLETKPGDFSFPKGYALRLTVNVKPTVKAYEKYQKNFMDNFDKTEAERQILGNVGYIDNVHGSNISGTRQATSGKWKKTGDKGTDQYSLYGETPESEFHTSSEKDGFYSNEGAYLEYERVKANNQRENPGKKLYKKPVVQVEPATLRIVKSFQGTSNSNEELELLKNCSFKLEEEKTAGTGVFTEVKSFKMMKSGTGTELGYLVSTELNGTAISGTGKNPTKTTPAGSLTEVMNGGEKQYVLTIKGLIPGRKYRVSEIIPSGKDTVTIAGKTLHFKKIDIIATPSRTINTGSSGAYVLETVNLSEAETKELKLKNIYETEEKQILRIQKKVSGTWGDRNLLFPFRLKLFKAGGASINQTDFDSLKANFSAATKSAISFDATDSTIRFSLKHGQGLDFLLPAGYQFQVGEDPKGYLPSVTSGYTLDMNPVDGYRFTTKKVLQKKTGGAQEVLEFENTKDPIPPMGALASILILPGNFLLFLLMLIFLLQGKKKEKRN
jgi:hypothetical protein